MIRDVVRIMDKADLRGDHHALRAVSLPVDFARDDIGSLSCDLRDTFYSMKISVGLAAPQIGERKRALVINLDKENRTKELLIINPTVRSVGGDPITKSESCMSIPNWRGPVERLSEVSVGYYNESGAHQELTARGFLARVLMHEIDHLNGVLYTDYISDLDILEAIDFYNPENYHYLPVRALNSEPADRNNDKS
jgi:peptide deformylase